MFWWIEWPKYAQKWLKPTKNSNFWYFSSKRSTMHKKDCAYEYQPICSRSEEEEKYFNCCCCWFLVRCFETEILDDAAKTILILIFVAHTSCDILFSFVLVFRLLFCPFLRPNDYGLWTKRMVLSKKIASFS